MIDAVTGTKVVDAEDTVQEAAVVVVATNETRGGGDIVQGARVRENIVAIETPALVDATTAIMTAVDEMTGIILPESDTKSKKGVVRSSRMSRGHLEERAMDYRAATRQQLRLYDLTIWVPIDNCWRERDRNENQNVVDSAKQAHVDA